jgi:2-amino-4-hydroxy-6-hydroxymethyldihydropteridine diphosphokinase
MQQVVLSLGSNLGSPEDNLTAAIRLIEERIGQVIATSGRRVTEPLLHPNTPTVDQPHYLNMVLAVHGSLAPNELLDRCQAIERALGRCREAENVRWGPRIIDIDIIAIGSAVIHTDRLVVPHPEMHKREFVLGPLCEICPDWRHPILKKSVQEMVDELSELDDRSG